ncbi:hypothetical protein EVAR_47572_1 [Eumeta japonica]|uniref:Uncharacterized protein n=2 Tax=Ditrysia TaxID=37567 RepID=A0A4C1WS17_EUMVA|nr:hypothetical protein EVAR_47572_1 [Eumeta japonica]
MGILSSSRLTPRGVMGTQIGACSVYPPSPQPRGATEGGVYIVYARGAVKHVGHTDFRIMQPTGSVRPPNRNFHRNIVFSSTASRTMISDGRTPSLKSGPFLVEEEFQRARKPFLRLPWLSRVTGNQGSIPEREPEKRLPHPRKAAGAQITHPGTGEPEVMIKRDRLGHSYCDVRGEILGSSQDEHQRKHLPKVFSSIKNEIGGAICLVNSGNERDSSLLNRRRHSGVRGVRVARLTGGVIKIFLEGPAASSRTRLSNNRSVMPLDVLGRTRATLKESACSPWPRGPGNPLKLLRAGDWGLQLSPINEEFLVSASHKLALITSLPFVHTARRYYRLNDLVRSSDRHAVALSAVGVAGKLTKLDHLEEDTFEHRHFERTLRSVETHPGPLLSEGRPYITKGHIANALALSRARVPFDN